MSRLLPPGSVALIIPCYRVSEHIQDVLAAVPDCVDRIFCVDDACPDGSGRIVAKNVDDPRVSVIYHKKNKGVGGAVKSGYLAARDAGCDIAVKIDGDGQMEPKLIPAFLHPIIRGTCDYTKGNRFYRLEDVQAMPKNRLFGNAVLSFFAKLSTGYWNVFDPTNGFTALHLSVLDLIQIEKVADRYFFETDLLFRLNIARCAVWDIPMVALYGNEKSGLRASRVFFPFLIGHFRNLIKRIFYSYFLRDFQIASLLLLLGPILLLAGGAFGIYHWWLSIVTSLPATAGTVMISALMIITGLQMTLAGLSFDMSNAPKNALHPLLAGNMDSVARSKRRVRNS